jgi:hypothetical protein
MTEIVAARPTAIGAANAGRRELDLGEVGPAIPVEFRPRKNVRGRPWPASPNCAYDPRPGGILAASARTRVPH